MASEPACSSTQEAKPGDPPPLPSLAGVGIQTFSRPPSSRASMLLPVWYSSGITNALLTRPAFLACRRGNQDSAVSTRDGKQLWLEWRRKKLGLRWPASNLSRVHGHGA
jgi:hypothetical protein